MRFYAMGNYYLSSIQQGIQAAHALGEMVVKYPSYHSVYPVHVLHDWMENHKTMVLLNGGNSADLQQLWTLLTDERNTEYPVSKFHEDEPSLNGALTCVAIVLPERLYSAEFKKYDKDISGHWQSPDGTWISGWEEELLNAIKSLGLAK